MCPVLMAKIMVVVAGEKSWGHLPKTRLSPSSRANKATDLYNSKLDGILYMQDSSGECVEIPFRMWV